MTLKRRWRCGCESILENPAFSAQGPCCTICNNTAPCAWVIQSACRHDTANGEFYLDRCTALVKEQDGCEWTSRWGFSNGNTFDESGDPYFDRPIVLGYCSTGKRPACGPGDQVPEVDNCSDTPFAVGLDNCCTWPEFAGRRACDIGFVKWRLTAIDTTTASLVCTTRDGNTATYLCTDWSCTEERSFTRSARTAGLQGIPPVLCVAPVNRSPTLVCDTIEDQCACCDYDFDVGTLFLRITGCSGFNGYHEVPIGRICAAEDLPCGVTYPTPAPCCVFAGSITSSADGCDESIYLIVWCDGTTYHVEAYCPDPNNPGCWVSQGEATVSLYECRCAGPYIEFEMPPTDCCCDSVVPSCGTEAIGNIVAEITIGAVGPVTVIMTNTGGDTWSGEAPLPCGGHIEGNLDLCYSGSPTAAISGWSIFDANGDLCFQFGGNQTGYTLSGTIDPLLFSSSAGTLVTTGPGDCSGCGFSEGDPVTEVYSE